VEAVTGISKVAVMTGVPARGPMIAFAQKAFLKHFFSA
jgi:hypothetical protein